MSLTVLSFLQSVSVEDKQKDYKNKFNVDPCTLCSAKDEHKGLTQPSTVVISLFSHWKNSN